MSHSDTRARKPAGGFLAEVEALADRVRGPVFVPGDDGYDEERTGFQTAYQHRPAMIVGALGAEDVRAAVEFAGAHGLPVAVQATGHGLSVAAEGGVLISTRRMTGVRVDPKARTAWLEAGVRWEQVVPEAARHGLAPLSGGAPHVGAVAYTLGGGLGLLARRFGYAADHVRGIDVVTADGRLRHVTAYSDPDLFWALRGGQGNFGVVTGLEVDLVPVARLYGGGLFFDADLVADVLHAYRQWTTAVPEEMTSSVALIPFPDLPAVPEPLRGRHVAHVRIAYVGDATTGERLVAPLRAVGPRLIDTVEEMPYTAAGSIHNDPAEPTAFCATNVLLRDLDAPAARTLLDLAGPGAQNPCIIELRHLGGALARPPAVLNAIGHRDARYSLGVLSPLRSAGIGTVRSGRERLERLLGAFSEWATGRCLNFMYGEHTAEQVRAAYDPHDYQRLVELKTGYDPTNTFRCNHNIPPANRHTAR